MSNNKKGWVIADFDGTGMMEVLRDDDENIFPDDATAAIAAIADGVRVIPVEELPANFERRYYGWVDTPENRAAIRAYCRGKESQDSDSINPADEELRLFHKLVRLVPLKRLKELAEADTKGMVLVSKIPIGTKVYQINQETRKEVRIIDGEEYYREVPDWYVSHHDYSWTDALVDAEYPERSGNPHCRYFFSKEEALAECDRINAGGNPSKISGEE